MAKDDADVKRRKILAGAIKETEATIGRDVTALAKIQDKFVQEYEKVLPEIQHRHEERAVESQKRHLKALSIRYEELKRLLRGDLVAVPWCGCIPIADFVDVDVCDHDVPVLDVANANQAQVSSGCEATENKAKPYVSLTGGGDGVDNRVELQSRLAFNVDQSHFPRIDSYCLTPTVLLSGYWLKENWGSCNGTVSSSGAIEIVLKVTATQLGGTKSLGTVQSEVFSWDAGDGYTGPIDELYNVSGTPSSRFRLVCQVDPADGDVFVAITLTISANITGLGRFLIDMKNSSAFYFWVERLELARHVPCLHCAIGPDQGACRIGGPDSVVQCKIGGPGSPVQCTIGGPGSEVLCKTGGPDSPERCRIGGPHTLDPCPGGPEIGCLAGPPLEVIIDPEKWERGQVALDLAKVPRSMRRSLSKMFERILQEG